MRIFLAAAVLATVTPVLAADLDLSNPADALEANRKIGCSTIDNKPVTYTWTGTLHSRRMGEPDKLIALIDGMNVRTCVTVNDPVRGKGYRHVSREILLYLDPTTGKPLETWKNPWTGKDVKVVQTMNDPVNMREPSFAVGKDGKPRQFPKHTVVDGMMVMSNPVPLFYHNPMGGDYQKYVGGVYHATEIFYDTIDMKSLLSRKTDTAKASIGWTRISDWLPWMEMQGREGGIYIQGSGGKVAGFAQLSPVMQDWINSKAPEYKVPPPGDDARPNVTSWTYFKAQAKAEELPRGGAN